MANGIDFTDAKAYRAYVETISRDLFKKIFLGFPSATLATAHIGLKGKHVLTELQVNSPLARRWAAAFRGTTNTKYVPETLEVVRNTVEHTVIPQEFQNSYLGILLKEGQDPADYPQQEYVLNTLVEKLLGELEVASWQAVAADVAADTDVLKDTFDGYLTQYAGKITDGSLTPVVTGALDETNTQEAIRSMYAELAPEYKLMGTDIIVSFRTFDNYLKQTKDKYKTDQAYIDINGQGYNALRYELGGGQTTMIPVAGMGDSGRIIMTPRQNLHMGYDSPMDWSNFNFEQQFRSLYMWMDFNYGVVPVQARDGITVINDVI